MVQTLNSPFCSTRQPSKNFYNIVNDDYVLRQLALHLEQILIPLPTSFKFPLQKLIPTSHIALLVDTAIQYVINGNKMIYLHMGYHFLGIEAVPVLVGSQNRQFNGICFRYLVQPFPSVLFSGDQNTMNVRTFCDITRLYGHSNLETLQKATERTMTGMSSKSGQMQLTND